jgi:hypothetical protein
MRKEQPEIDCTLNDYIVADENLIATSSMTEHEIIAQVKEKYSDSVDLDDSEDDEQVPDIRIPSTQMIREHLSDIIAYINSIESVDDNVFSALATLDTFVNDSRHAKQRSITDFFK